MLTAFPSNIVQTISRIIDILTGNVRPTEIYDELTKWYGSLPEGSIKDFAYYIGNSLYDFFNWFMKNSLDLMSKLFNSTVSRAAGYLSDIKQATTGTLSSITSFFGGNKQEIVQTTATISKEVINNTDQAIDKIGGAIVATINKIKSLPTDAVYGTCTLAIQTAKSYLTYVWNTAYQEFGCSDFNQFTYSISIFASVLSYFYAILNGVLGLVPPVKRFVYDTVGNSVTLVGGVVVNKITGVITDKFVEKKYIFINSAFFSENYFKELNEYNLFIGSKVGLLETKIKDLELSSWLEGAEEETDDGMSPAREREGKEYDRRRKRAHTRF
jgi:hypothetical protein